MALHLITGGSGVLGRALTKALLGAGHEVAVLDPKPPPDGMHPGMMYVKGGVTDPSALARAAKGADVVHHLAASMPQARLSARGFWELNVGGTMNAARAAIDAGARRFVFASTIEVYGLHFRHEFPVTEDAEKRFTGTYSRNKLECEERLLEMMDKEGLEPVFPRMPMIFGPGFYHEPSMTMLFRLIKRGLPVPVLAAPDAPWASVSAADAAHAFLLAAESPAAPGKAFNIAAADAPPCARALRELIETVGSDSRVIEAPTWVTKGMIGMLERLGGRSPTPPELLRFALVGGEYSIGRAREELGYNPVHGAVEAMATAYRCLYPGFGS